MKLLLLVALGVVATQAEQSQVLKDFSTGYNQFTANVYKELLKSNSGNFVVCPLSVNLIVALTANGARGETAQQLATGLQLPQDREKVKQIFRELAPHLKGDDKYTLTSANKIYLKDGFGFLDEFKSTAVDVFKSDIENIDFLKKTEATAEMNKWIAEQTDNKIQKVIKEEDLNEHTFAVLINAMYFHGKWKMQFNEGNTKKRTFHASNQQEKQVEMMEITKRFKYYESAELKAKFVELPYMGNDVTMTFVLPNDVEGLPALEARIFEVISEQKQDFEDVHVVIPKFKVESTTEFKPIFQALGVQHAFDENRADFSGLTASPTKISKIVQKAFVQVEEKGTTAAAASVVIQEFRTAHQVLEPPKEFIADHPFIYYLKSPAGILFIGRYVQG